LYICVTIAIIKKKYRVMPFYSEIGGVWWELNSFKEWFETVIACCLGKLTAWAVMIGLVVLFFNKCT
jgi:hypothetical protein